MHLLYIQMVQNLSRRHNVVLKKPEMMLSYVTQGNSKELPKILGFPLPECFTEASLSKFAWQQDNFTTIWYYEMPEKYFKTHKTLASFNPHSWLH